MSKKNKSSSPEITPAEPSKLFTNLLRSTRQYIEGRNYVPSTFSTLLEKLALPEQHKKIFREILKTLEREKCIRLRRGLYEHHKDDEEVSTGIISMHPRGFGFVKPDEPSADGDIFIPKHLTMNAVDGDHVEVAINTEVVSEKGPEGKVLAILSRNRTHIAGIITSVSSYGEILAYVPLLGSAQNIVVEPSETFPVKEGDRVVMHVLEWGTRDEDTRCVVSHHLGHISDPSCDIAAAIEEYDLRSEFPSKVLKEAESYGKVVAASDIAARKDLRDLECFTIDPTTAKDFDDALTLSKDAKGMYHLIVHIADVAHYVSEGSPLDIEAGKRCNSTYFPGTCLPMLPPALSENLCSLKPNVNRLTISVSMDFDPQGNMLSYQIFRSVIKSSKRFTYESAKEVLDGKRKSKHADTLHLMVELCHILKQKRFDRGSIEFALPDLVIKVDGTGTPLDTEYVSYDITHQMVEEFMLKANETVAQHLDKEGKGVAYRVHEEPSSENMKDFSILAGAFGFSLPEKPRPHQLQELFKEALDTPYGQYLFVSYIRRMRQALYSPENIGHYGLGLTHYCHFTSPIRRYVDLVIHRSLFSASLEHKTLDKLTKQCSEQERISAKAENSVLLLKKLRLLDRIHQEMPYKQYEAVVTRVKNFGFSFEVLDYLLEGFLHVSELDQDYFVFDGHKMRLVGRHTNKVYASGERITIMLKKVNFITLESNWSLVSDRQEKRREHSKFRGSEKHQGRRKGRRDSFTPVEAPKKEIESILDKKTPTPKRKPAKETTLPPVEHKAKTSKEKPKGVPTTKSKTVSTPKPAPVSVAKRKTSPKPKTAPPKAKTTAKANSKTKPKLAPKPKPTTSPVTKPKPAPRPKPATLPLTKPKRTPKSRSSNQDVKHEK